MRFTRRSLALAAGAGVLAACAGLAEGGSAPPGEFITTLDGDGGPPVQETYVGTPGTSTMNLVSLAGYEDVCARPSAKLACVAGCAKRGRQQWSTKTAPEPYAPVARHRGLAHPF